MRAFLSELRRAPAVERAKCLLLAMILLVLVYQSVRTPDVRADLYGPVEVEGHVDVTGSTVELDR